MLLPSCPAPPATSKERGIPDSSDVEMCYENNSTFCRKRKKSQSPHLQSGSPLRSISAATLACKRSMQKNLFLSFFVIKCSFNSHLARTHVRYFRLNISTVSSGPSPSCPPATATTGSPPPEAPDWSNLAEQIFNLKALAMHVSYSALYHCAGGALPTVLHGFLLEPKIKQSFNYQL